MNDVYLLLFLAALLAGMGMLTMLALRRMRAARNAANQAAYIRGLLEDAQAQRALFEICPQPQAKGDVQRNAMPATLMRLTEENLEMEILAFVPHDLAGEPVEVYFRVRLPEGPRVFKFRSVIKTVRSERDKSRLNIATPKDIGPGEKRRFFRVNPPKEVVRIIGLWELEAGKPFPRNTSEIGRPLLHYKFGSGNETIQVADVSATGLALSFPLPDPENPPVHLDLNSQALCLLVYHMAKDNRMVTFWCTCDVVNKRTPQEPEPALILGMRFTNWAVMEQGRQDINWFHSKKESGVAPITQWVMQIDLERHRGN